METQQTQEITKETIISQILEIDPSKAPLLTEMLMDFGIHCVGCGASTFETLEQGVLGHGYSPEQLDKLVIDINKALAEKTPTQDKPTIIQDFKLTLTPAALQKVKDSLKTRGTEDASLRVSVTAGGCSGFMYDMEFINTPNESDLKFKQDTVTVAVDKGSMDQLNGMEIDFVDTLNESGFKFNNPNATQGCGCGKSFH